MRQLRIEAELGHTPLGPCQDREFWHYVLDAAVIQISGLYTRWDARGTPWPRAREDTLCLDRAVRIQHLKRRWQTAE